jgi:predicted nucleic acid-binding Zn ribbon protein
MTLYRRAPRPIESPLAALRDGWEPGSSLAAVQRLWGEVVGPATAAEASPVAIRAGVLTVRCTSSVWAHELELMAPGILAGLATRIPGLRLTRLRFTAEGPQVPGGGRHFP